MLAFLRRLFSKASKSSTPAAPRESQQSPISVRFDDWGVYADLNGGSHAEVAWKDIRMIAVRIEDAFFPFPYWYVGNEQNLLRIPNDAQGAKELFFDGFSDNIPGYECDATFRMIVEASCAMEGSFILWKAVD